MPPKHTIDTKIQGSLLAPPDAAIDMGMFKAEADNAYFPQDPSDKVARLISLLDSLNHLMELNSSQGMIKGTHVPDIREDMVERLGSSDKLSAKIDDKKNNENWREQQARTKFEYATGHDKRLKRMSPKAAEAVTDRALGNFIRKYAQPNSPKAAKNRRQLRTKVQRIASKK